VDAHFLSFVFLGPRPRLGRTLTGGGLSPSKQKLLFFYFCKKSVWVELRERDQGPAIQPTSNNGAKEKDGIS
jgi:hypothetical protein